VERDHWSADEVHGRLHTTRWGIVMRGAQSQAPGSQPALAELCRLHWSPLCMFAWLRGVLREVVGPMCQIRRRPTRKSMLVAKL
jgi:hypothetical protein